jgi:hypothetical protein
MRKFSRARIKHIAIAAFCGGSILAALAFLVSCSGSNTMMTPGQATITVSLSDPPSCMPPNGQFTHVFITVRSVQAHTSASATDSTPGWQELAPQLADAPMQIDLFSKPETTCILAQLGSASLPVGNYQQIRLLLESNTPAAGAAVPSPNACAGNGFNCVVLSDNSIHELVLSSEDNTGLKIPPGQIVGGPLQVSAGQSIDLNIDFNACASIVQQGNGVFRLKPTLTAGQVGANASGIGGQVVDSQTKAPIAGQVLVAIEQPDTTGTDQIMMQTAADSNGNFRFCPLPVGTFDIVVVAVGPNNLPYNATAVANVPNGSDLGAIPLVAETGASAPGVLQGFVTATTGTAGATADVSLAALQQVTFGTAMATTRQLYIPLETIKATTTTPETDSTGLISVSSTTNCPTGSPMNANCAQYTLVVPASNPSIGVFSSNGVSYAPPVSGPALYTVSASAAIPMSGGTANDCTPPSLTTSSDINNQPLQATAGMTTNVSRLDFKGCS